MSRTVQVDFSKELGRIDSEMRKHRDAADQIVAKITVESRDFTPDEKKLVATDSAPASAPDAPKADAAAPVTPPAARHAPAERRRKSGPSLRTFFRVADAWRLDPEEQRAAERTRERLRAGVLDSARYPRPEDPPTK